MQRTIDSLKFNFTRAHKSDLRVRIGQLLLFVSALICICSKQSIAQEEHYIGTHEGDRPAYFFSNRTDTATYEITIALGKLANEDTQAIQKHYAYSKIFAGLAQSLFAERSPAYCKATISAANFPDLRASIQLPKLNQDTKLKHRDCLKVLRDIILVGKFDNYIVLNAIAEVSHFMMADREVKPIRSAAQIVALAQLALGAIYVRGTPAHAIATFDEKVLRDVNVDDFLTWLDTLRNFEQIRTFTSIAELRDSLEIIGFERASSANLVNSSSNTTAVEQLNVTAGIGSPVVFAMIKCTYSQNINTESVAVVKKCNLAKYNLGADFTHLVLDFLPGETWIVIFNMNANSDNLKDEEVWLAKTRMSLLKNRIAMDKVKKSPQIFYVITAR
jgi:hypothetical protein